MNKEKICILMATYNGASYLPTQLASIQAQTFKNWVLIIRDDGSQDATLKILHPFAHHDKRIQILTDDQGNLGSTRNFAYLMEWARKKDFAYIAFSDQDDFWVTEKLAVQFAQLQQLESKYGSSTPLMVYSDLTVVNEQLEQIHPSFQQYQGIHHTENFSLALLIGQNIATGCTLLINRALLQKCLPLPAEAVVHDWWISLVVAALGKVSYSAKPLVHYRQHAANQIGVVKINPRLFLDKSALRAFLIKNTRNFLTCLQQAQALSTHLHNLGEHEIAEFAEKYATLLQKPFLERVAILYHSEFCKQGLLRKLAFYFRVLVLNKFLLKRAF